MPTDDVLTVIVHDDCPGFQLQLEPSTFSHTEIFSQNSFYPNKHPQIDNDKT